MQKDKVERRLIVEIGCGNYPWILWHQLCLSGPDKYVPGMTSIMNEYANLTSGDRFICIDIKKSCIRKAAKNLHKLRKENVDLKPTSVVFRCGDGAKLSTRDKTADAVILSDVLCAPRPGTTPVSEPYPEEICIDETDKWDIVQESIRILKDGGMFIIGICQTPCYAKYIMQKIQKDLVEKGVIQLTKQCGEFVSDSDNWHLYHAAFQKNPGPFCGPAELIPWTEAQKKYINNYASSWAMAMW